MRAINRRDLVMGGSLLAAGTALGGCASDASSSLSISAKPTVDPMSLVHRDLRSAASVIKSTQIEEWNEETLRTARSSPSPGDRARLPEVSVTEHLLQGSKGAPEVKVFVINAKPGEFRPGVLHMHGGGFVTGSASSDIRFLQEFVQDIYCTVVTVDYRLAPETIWSGSVEDNYVGLKWLHDHAEELGVDRSKLAVMGGSAGGGHAALLAIAARDRGEIPLAFQSLTYPMLDDRTGNKRRVPEHIGNILWTRQANQFGWQCFLGQMPGGGTVPVAAVPARAKDLTGLPPAWIGVGTLDLFVEENIEYARRLVNAGVSTELNVVPGAFHGFDFIPGSNVSRSFAKSRVNAFRHTFDMELLP